MFTTMLSDRSRTDLGSPDMEFIRCWLLHRSTWTILIPGVLPGNFDAVAYCPTCDAGRGHRQLRLASSGARA